MGLIAIQLLVINIHADTISNNQTQCNESWACTKFSQCINTTMSRSCVDINRCGTSSDKPVESIPCKSINSDSNIDSQEDNRSSKKLSGAAVGVSIHAYNPDYTILITLIIAVTALFVITFIVLRTRTK